MTVPNNPQYSDPKMPGFGPGIADTGAEGSQGVTTEGSPPQLADVVVTVPGSSSQPPQPHVGVNVGDTSAMSSDSPIPAGGDPLTGLRPDFVLATGAGQGRGHNTHPNSQWHDSLDPS